MINPEPPDPDIDDVPPELLALAGEPSVRLVTGDGVSSDGLLVVPGLWGHARRLRENFYDDDDNGGST